jgi:hypothetical protein
MRELSDTFIACLKKGFLAGILRRVNEDKDLDLQIRNNYINIYYKGNSLLKLTEINSKQYLVKIHSKFTSGLKIPSKLIDDNTTNSFLENIPFLKENIIKYGSTLEIEYHQMIIRANNLEKNNNTEYFIVDREYDDTQGRLDLAGFFWSRQGRKKEQYVIPCFMEVKFALNPDIKDLCNQLNRYYESIKEHPELLSKELETIFKQKLKLGLFNKPIERLKAMETLKFSNSIEDFQFNVILVDYNPNSKKLNLESLKKLPFSKQIKIFYSGFGMWQQSFKTI